MTAQHKPVLHTRDDIKCIMVHYTDEPISLLISRSMPFATKLFNVFSLCTGWHALLLDLELASVICLSPENVWDWPCAWSKLGFQDTWNRTESPQSFQQRPAKISRATHSIQTEHTSISNNHFLLHITELMQLFIKYWKLTDKHTLLNYL